MFETLKIKFLSLKNLKPEPKNTNRPRFSIEFYAFWYRNQQMLKIFETQKILSQKF